MPDRLLNRVALITGSSSGLGRAIASLFAAEGAKCFLVDKFEMPRNPVDVKTGMADDWESRTSGKTVTGGGGDKSQTTEAVAAAVDTESGDDAKSTFELLKQRVGDNNVAFHQADLTIEKEVIRAMEACVAHYGRLDILVNSHGISVESTHPKPLRCHEYSYRDYERTMGINCASVFLTCKYALGVFVRQVEEFNSTSTTTTTDEHGDSIGEAEREGKGRGLRFEGGNGWIVNVASVQGLVPYYATSAYCASKGAVVMLSKQIALDYAVDGIRCNAVCPGFLDTNMTRNLQADTAKVKSVADRQPLNTGQGREGKLGNVADVARMVLVLASDDARWVTGQSLVVDGGYMLT